MLLSPALRYTCLIAATILPVGCADAPRISAVAFSLADTGLNIPESAVHDVAGNVYYVSNINGSPFGEDGKGFISRVSVDGTNLALKWIDGGREGVTLNAPKGMAVVGDLLYVADVSAVRKFDRRSGAPKGSIAVEGATFLNDLASGSDGTVYVTDTGLGPGFAGTGSDAIYAIAADDKVTTLVKGADLAKPNGLFVDGDRLLMVSWDGGALNVVADGKATAIARLPENQLDGIVKDGSGNFLISSWAGKCCYRVTPDGEISVAVPELEAPADIGWNSESNLLLLPWFNGARLDVLTVP